MKISTMFLISSTITNNSSKVDTQRSEKLVLISYFFATLR